MHSALKFFLDQISTYSADTYWLLLCISYLAESNIKNWDNQAAAALHIIYFDNLFFKRFFKTFFNIFSSCNTIFNFSNFFPKLQVSMVIGRVCRKWQGTDVLCLSLGRIFWLELQISAVGSSVLGLTKLLFSQKQQQQLITNAANNYFLSRQFDRYWRS